jgi:hypothetical protein
MSPKALISRIAAGCAFAASLALTGPVQATSLQTTGWLAPPPLSFGVHRTVGGNQNVQAGGFNGIWDNTTPIVFWCFDLDHFFSLGNTYDYTASALGGSIADTLARLFNEAYGSAGASNVNSAAFQLAIWNILYDSDSSVSNGQGSFYATSGNAAAIAQANTWLQNLAADGGSYSITYLHSNAHPESQNFITVSRIPRLVPEPPMLALLALALGAIVLLQGRRVRSRGE